MRDENYLIETFSFIYYSVSERCHLAAAGRRGAADHSGEIGFAVNATGFARARARSAECNVLRTLSSCAPCRIPVQEKFAR